jgi:hypothetical protein
MNNQPSGYGSKASCKEMPKQVWRPVPQSTFKTIDETMVTLQDSIQKLKDFYDETERKRQAERLTKDQIDQIIQAALEAKPSE